MNNLLCDCVIMGPVGQPQQGKAAELTTPRDPLNAFPLHTVEPGASWVPFKGYVVLRTIRDFNGGYSKTKHWESPHSFVTLKFSPLATWSFLCTQNTCYHSKPLSFPFLLLCLAPLAVFLLKLKLVKRLETSRSQSGSFLQTGMWSSCQSNKIKGHYKIWPE